MSASTGYFICTVGIAGNPRNCSPVDAPQTMSADDMTMIIGALWGAIAIAFAFRLMAKAMFNR